MKDPSAKRNASFAVWYAPGAPDDSEALTDMLTEHDNAVVRQYDTRQGWMAAQADVLVLRGTDEPGMTRPEDCDAFLSGNDVELLKGRRVFGIGHEASLAFGAMGLDVHNGRAMCVRDSEPTIRLGTGLSVPTGSAGAALVAFRSGTLSGGQTTWGVQVLCLPAIGELAAHVEAIARYAGDPNYSAISRQGNVVLCGISADIRSWTPEFKSVCRGIAIALARRPHVPFNLSEWEIAPPGTYRFELATFGETEFASGKSFFFKFPDPVLFSAQLEMSRGGAVRLFFHGHATSLASDRIDATDGEPVSILMPVTRRCAAANGDRYWELRVENFDSAKPASCTMRIGYQTGAVMRFADGSAVSLLDPPQDASTVTRLLEFLKSDVPDVARRAEAALLTIGEPAVPILEGAGRSACRDLRHKIARITRRITERRLG